jgi:fido (protein-threonine AMPylation protein)
MLSRSEIKMKGAYREAFCRSAGSILGEINALHPFREGNGRAQRWELRLSGRL